MKIVIIAAHNNSVCTNFIQAKIYITQQNSEGGLYSDMGETIYHIIFESCKQAQKDYQLGTTRNCGRK